MFKRFTLDNNIILPTLLGDLRSLGQGKPEEAWAPAGVIAQYMLHVATVVTTRQVKIKLNKKLPSM